MTRTLFYILFGALFTAALCVAAGFLLQRVLHLRFARGERFVLAFPMGASLVSTLVFLICSLHWARKGVFLWVGLAVIALAIRFRPEAAKPLPPMAVRLPLKALAGAIFAVFGVLYFFNALAPESSPDGATYHLGLVARYLRERGFQPITDNMYANLSQGLEMLFLVAYSFGRHSSAALVHFTFALALGAMMVLYGRRFGLSKAALYGALFTFLSPVFGIDATSAYNDVAVATTAFALFYLLQLWASEHDPNPRLLIPIGLVAGFGYALKYTAFVAVLYALGFVAWHLWRRKQPALRALLAVAFCAAPMTLPWMLKNWLWLGNPVSPFFNAVFPNPYVHVSFEREYTAYLRTYEMKSLWQIPIEVTMGGDLAGVIGPLFLLAPLALLALRWKEGRQLLLAALVFGCTYPTNIGARFLLFALPFLSIAMAMVFVRSRGVAPVLLAAHAVASWPPVLKGYALHHVWSLEKVPVQEALRRVPEEQYLNERLPLYAITRLMEEAVPPGAKVLSFDNPPEAYSTRHILVAYRSAFSKSLEDVLWTALTPELTPLWQRRFRMPRESFRRIRVVQTALGQPDVWSISEMRFFRDGVEIPRHPDWRLRAHPNPWDVQHAFDNSPVTRWRSWQTIYPGMYMEVDFGKVEIVDSVLLECSFDQYQSRVRLEGEDAQGRWRRIAGAPEESMAQSFKGLRAAAAFELKQRGVGYLLVQDFEFGAGDFQRHYKSWGLRQLGERNGARLYKIE